MNLPPYLYPCARQLSSAEPAVFFAAVPPPWEALAAQELQAKLSMRGIALAAPPQILAGGIEFTVPLAVGLRLNHDLKIPSRLLLRLAKFKCRDFPTLFKKARQIFWGQFLNEVAGVEFTAHHTRLINSRKVEKALTDAVQASLQHWPPGKVTTAQTIFVRVAEDTAQISIDTSGERLDRRAYRQKIGRAPLRENLAAALIYFLAQNFARPWAEATLFAPMCGAGTFLTEAASFFAPFDRAYAFQKWHRIGRLKIDEQLAGKVVGLATSSSPALPFTSFWGMDCAAPVLAAAAQNTAALRQKFPGLPELHWVEGDVFQAKLSLKHPLVMILNPPYGRRLPLKTPPRLYYQKLWQSLQDDYHPEVLALLMPRSYLAALPPPTTAVACFNGGQKTVFACWAK